MVDYDDRGYIASGPLMPKDWRKATPDEPDGLVVLRNVVPPGIFLVQNYLDPQLCDKIVKECEKVVGVRHTVGDNSSGKMTTVSSDKRKSEQVNVRHLNVDIINIVQEAYLNAVAPHFNVELDWFETPSILRYRQGGEYHPHADADNWNPNNKCWNRGMNRDLSILMYLNEGYGGGEITFPNFRCTLKPKRGLLVAFPSDARYIHAAKPVTSGIRYAVVSWAAIKGSPRVETVIEPDCIRV